MEAASCSRLEGDGLEDARAALEENAEGCCRLAEIALGQFERGKSYHPLGLFVKMVRQGRHRLAPPAVAP